MEDISIVARGCRVSLVTSLKATAGHEHVAEIVSEALGECILFDCNGCT